MAVCSSNKGVGSGIDVNLSGRRNVVFHLRVSWADGIPPLQQQAYSYSMTTATGSNYVYVSTMCVHTLCIHCSVLVWCIGYVLGCAYGYLLTYLSVLAAAAMSPSLFPLPSLPHSWWCWQECAHNPAHPESVSTWQTCALYWNALYACTYVCIIIRIFSIFILVTFIYVAPPNTSALVIIESMYVSGNAYIKLWKFDSKYVHVFTY